MKIPWTNTLTPLTVAWTDAHLYLCVFAILRDPSWRRPENDWRQFSCRRMPVDGQELPTERQRRKSLLFLWEWFWGCESTFLRRQREHAALVSCLFVGEIWAVSNEFLITEKGTHYHFCILSPFHSSPGFVSTKSAKAVFFVAQFSSLVNQSGVTYVMS